MRKATGNLPEWALFTELECSTAHIRRGDSYMLDLLAEAEPEKDWLCSLPEGHLIRLSARRFPVLELKRRGFSRELRWLAFVACREGCRSLYIGADGFILEGFDTFDW
ncbi:DUF5983 family protein [Scandinavium sp. NPDC088450]|uniref:DUF5983 family protein n=1 Tax=Scandinavium sp. NPDC088450 TaxID=3364514 RepID=UPI00384BC07C